MKKTGLIIAALVVLLVALLIVFKEPLVLRITGIRPFVEERFGGWVEAGADEDELDAAPNEGSGFWKFDLWGCVILSMHLVLLAFFLFLL